MPLIIDISWTRKTILITIVYYLILINESFCFLSNNNNNDNNNNSNNNNNKFNLMRLDKNSILDKSLPNSPIIYLKLKQSSQQMTSAINNNNNNNNQDRYLSAIKNEIKTGITRKNSNIFKLPLKFISNGKPSKIIPVTNNYQLKNPTKSVFIHTNTKYGINGIYNLPTKFISNGKPVKSTIIKNKNTESNNNTNDHHHYNKNVNNISHLNGIRNSYGYLFKFKYF